MSRSRTRKSSARRTPRILPQGVLKMSGAGYGFVQTSEGEFFIPASKTADAFDGDVVEVAHIHDGEREGGFEDRLRGRVVRVVGRAHETVVGRYEIAEPFGVVVPEDPHIKHDIFACAAMLPHAKDGDIVRVRMTSFPSRRARAGRGRGSQGTKASLGPMSSHYCSLPPAGNIVFGNIACRS